MVDGINQADLNALSRYAYGLPEDEKEIQKTPLPIVTGIGTAKAYDASKWTINFFKDKNTNWQNLKTTDQSLKNGNIWQRAKKYNRHFKLEGIADKVKPLTAPNFADPSAPTVKELLKNQKYLKAEKYNDVRRLIGEARTLSGKPYAAKMKEINKALAEANLSVHNAKISGNLKPLTKTGKVAQFAKKWTGYNFAKGKGLKAVANSKALRYVGKVTRGKGVLTGVALLSEAPSLAATYSTLGNARGNKQLGKTLVVAGAGVASYAVGAKAGAAMGAVIGSVVPGLGTIVGGILGAAVGLGASYLACNYAQKIVGKSELELAQDEQAAALATEAGTNPDLLAELMAATQGKAQNDTNISENIINSYERVANAAFPEEGEAESATSSAESATSSAESATSSAETSAETAQKAASTTTAGKATTAENKLSPEVLARTKERLLAFIKAMLAPPETRSNNYSAGGFGMPQQGMGAFNPYMMNNQFGYMG